MKKKLNEIYNLSKEVGNRINILPYDIFYNCILRKRETDLELNIRCSVCNNTEKNEWLEILDDGKAYGCNPLPLMVGDITQDSFEEIMSRISELDTPEVIQQAQPQGQMRCMSVQPHLRGISSKTLHLFWRYVLPGSSLCSSTKLTFLIEIKFEALV